MATYYVDLALGSNPGYLVNDPMNPMGWTQFVALSNTSNTFYTKNSRDSSATNLVLSCNIYAWDASNPWRINVNSISFSFSSTVPRILKDGIIRCVDFTTASSPLVLQLYDMVLIATSQVFFNRYLSWIRVSIKGSTLITSLFRIHAYDGHSTTTQFGLELQDSIISLSTMSVIQEPGYTMNVKLQNSAVTTAFTLPSYCNIIINSGFQTNWVAPSWPAWNAEKASWVSSIATGLNTPPQPGTIPYTDYENGLWGSLRQGIGAFYFSSNMLFMSQRTNRHIVKSLLLGESSVSYNNHFGTYGTSGNTNTLLNSPWGVAVNANGHLFVCDHLNERIVKLDSNLNYVDEYSTSLTIGKPCAILAETDIYVAGINYHIINNNVLYMYVNIEKLDEDFVSLKVTNDTLGVYQRLEQKKGEIGFKPISLLRGYDTDEILIAGIRKKLYSTTELVGGFSTLIEKPFYKERPLRIIGMIKHSNGFLYMNSGTKLHKFDSAFTNVGDTDFIGKTIYGLSERLNGNLLTYKADNQSLVEYSTDMNFVKEVIVDSGNTVQTDLYDVMSIVEAAY